MKKSKPILFILFPIVLIAIVFFTTLIFSNYLKPIMLAIVLMLAYYGAIWISLFVYKILYLKNDSLFKRDELLPNLKVLTPWMYLYAGVYPFAVGVPVFIFCSKYVPTSWILGGVVFSIINGPSEELYWRLLMEKIGNDSGINKNIRLWCSSILFSSWHFIFIIFLFPKEMWIESLVSVHILTFITGLLWMLMYQKSKNIFPNIFSHTVLNFLMIWPYMVGVVLGVLPIS